MDRRFGVSKEWMENAKRVWEKWDWYVELLSRALIQESSEDQLGIQGGNHRLPTYLVRADIHWDGLGGNGKTISTPSPTSCIELVTYTSTSRLYFPRERMPFQFY